MRQDFKNIVLFIIILFALALRLYPVMANMPYTYWHDENNYIESAMRFGTGNFNPMTFSHGGLFQLILFIVYGVYYVLQKMIGSVHSPVDFYVNYIKDPTPFFVMARSISALCGTAAGYLTYLIGSRIYNKRVGIVAAFFTSFSLLMVQTSFLALADMASVLILLAFFYILIQSVEEPKDYKMYYISALLIGLAFACKYYVVFAVATLYVAALLKARDFPDPWRNFIRLAFFGSFFVFIGFAIGMPYFIVRFADFYKDTFVRMGGEYIVRNPIDDAWLFYFTHHLSNGLGILLESLVILGILYAFYRKSPWDILLLSFPIAYYLLFMHSVGYAYHMLPAIPFVLILAARFLDEAACRYFNRFSTAVVVCIAILVTVPTSLEAVKFAKVIASGDTRTEARAWIQENVPQDSLILAEGYLSTVPVHAPPIGDNMKTLERDLAHTLSSGRGSGFFAKTRIANYGLLYGKSRSFNVVKVDTLTTKDVDSSKPAYIIMTSENDRIAGAELAYYVEKGYHKKRKLLKDYISEKFALVKTFLPTCEFTLWFPHLVDDDYRLLRRIPLNSMENFTRGPRIDIYMRK